MKNKILIIEDDSSVAFSIKGILEDEGYSVDHVESGEAAIDYYKTNTPTLALLDIWLPGIDGLSAMTKIKEKVSDSNFIVMSGHGNIETAVKATKLGAFDYIEKPISMEKLLLTINNLLSLKKLKEENKQLKASISKGPKTKLIGKSPLMKKLHDQVNVVADTSSWVLITGNNGVGKELVANLIHCQSTSSDGPFVEVNSAAIPEELIESELFGHEKGAFTGAVARKRGKFDVANGGTLFLDEIGDMSLKTQAKILRILEEQKFERVGGNEQIQVSVRVIAATNKDLTEEIENGRFRSDLYYRLNVIPIYVPPLRERYQDIPLLVEFFLKEFSVKNNREVKTFSSEAMDILMKYDWPGNVRELKNLMERLMIMIPGNCIEKDDLPSEIQKFVDAEIEVLYERAFNVNSLKDAKDEFEKLYLEKKLKDCKGNVSKTAQSIGMDRTSLHRKIKLYKICIED